MTAAIPEGLIRYLAARDRDRVERVDRTLAELTLRERHLIKEAAVMGYVQGTLAAGGVRAEIPPDSVVLRDVVAACLAMSDLYPTIARGDQP